MSKLFRTFLIIFMIFIISIGFYTVLATDEEFEAGATANIEDTVSDSSAEENENVSENENENVIKENASDGSLQSLTPSSVTSVSNKNNYSNANLELNNILCIILISIGVLLILFAIAILIRLKR